MTRRGSRCSVNGCLNFKILDSQKFSFYRLPKNSERCALWLKLICRPDLEEILKVKGPENLHNNHVVCSEHFMPKDFRNKRFLSQGLVPNAVPSVFNNCGPNADVKTSISTFLSGSGVKKRRSDVNNEIVKNKICVKEELSDLDSSKNVDWNISRSATHVAISCNNEKRESFSKSVPLPNLSSHSVDVQKKFVPILPKPGPVSSPSDLINPRTVVSSNPSNALCPSQFFLVNDKRDANLTVSPVVLLLAAEGKEVCMMDKPVPSSSLQDKTASSTSRTTVKKKGFSRKNIEKSILRSKSMPASTPSISSKLNRTAKVNNRNKEDCLTSNMVIPLRPKDVDITEIRVLDRNITSETNTDNVAIISSSSLPSLPSVSSVPIKRGVDYRIIDGKGCITYVTASSLCRICGRYGEEHLIPLLSDVCKKNHVPEIINKYLPIKITKDKSKLPNNICHLCVSYLIDWQRLVSKCLTTDKWLHEIFNVAYEDTSITIGNENSESQILQNHLLRKVTAECEKNATQNLRCSSFRVAKIDEQCDHDYCSNGSQSVVTSNYEKSSDNATVGKCYVKSKSYCPAQPVTNNNIDFASTTGSIFCCDEASENDAKVNVDFSNVSQRKRKLCDSLVNKNLNSFDRKRYKSNCLSVVNNKNKINSDDVCDSTTNHNYSFNENSFSSKLCEDSGEQQEEISEINEQSTIELDAAKSHPDDISSVIVKDEIDHANDDDSRDTLSPPPQPLLFDVLANVSECEDGNAEAGENIPLLCKDVMPSKSLSSERYIAKQRYKVGITLTKLDRKESIGYENNKALMNNNQTLVEDGLDSINISVSKEDKSNYKLVMKAMRYTKHCYSRLSIFDCEHCVFYQMTANEFGKHMKSFHPDKPLSCPICKRIFKEDYNLIIHLQVTSCGKLRSFHNNIENNNNNADDSNCDEDPIMKSDLSESAELNLTVKMTDHFFDGVSVQSNSNYSSTENGVNKVVEAIVSDDQFQLKYGNDDDNGCAMQSYKTEKLFYEVSIETWKPSTTCVSFEPGIVILDGLNFLSPRLICIVKEGIEKLLKMKILSTLDCTALKTMLDTKVNQVLKSAQDDDKMMSIKSVVSVMTGIKNAGSLEEQFNPETLEKPLKSLFHPIKKGGPSLKDIYLAGSFMKVLKRGRPRNENTFCNKCNTRFRNCKSLNRHKRMHHIDGKCRYCDLVFSLLSELNRHEKEHEKNNMLCCKTCDTKFSTKEAIQKHNLLMHNIGDYMTCEYCGKQFFTKSSLQTHKKNVHSTEQHLCSHCGQIYRSLSGLKCHIQSNHIVQTDVICPVCKKSFRNRRKLNVHMGAHRQKNKTYTCEICHKSFQSATGIKQHQQRHMTVPVAFCLICGMGSKRASRVTTHIKEMHWTSINRPAEEQFPCLVCGVMLDDGDSLSQHMMFHSEDSVIKELHGTDNEGKVKCQDCEKFLFSKKELALHKFYIHKDIPFKCYIDNCNIKFWSKAALDAHGKAIHGRFTYECKRCDETFNSVKKKNVHLQRVHLIEVVRNRTTQASRICEVCNKSFCSSFSLSRHWVDIHQRVKQRFTCDSCGKCFNFKYKLDKHLLWHIKPRLKEKTIRKENLQGPESNVKTEDTIIEEDEVVISNFADYGDDFVDNNAYVGETNGDNKGMDYENNHMTQNDSKEECHQTVGESSMVPEKVLSMCTVYRCTVCNITYKSKLELCNHFREEHKHDDQLVSFEPNEVLELSVVE